METGRVNEVAEVSSVSIPTATTRFRQAVQLLGCCLLWVCFSTSIILVNRILIRDLGFPFPIALSFWGQGATFTTAWFVCDVLQLVPPASNISFSFYITRVSPIGAAQGVAIWLSNKLYLLLTVSGSLVR
jgi:hypothetical protein